VKRRTGKKPFERAYASERRDALRQSLTTNIAARPSAQVQVCRLVFGLNVTRLRESSSRSSGGFRGGAGSPTTPDLAHPPSSDLKPRVFQQPGEHFRRNNTNHQNRRRGRQQQHDSDRIAATHLLYCNRQRNRGVSDDGSCCYANTHTSAYS
jgi:hypothetical protein